MPSIDIRVLEVSDWENYKNIRLKALKNAPKAFGDSYEEAKNRTNDHFRDRLISSTVVGAFSGDIIIGVAGYYSDTALKCRHIGNIWGVYVDTDYREIGVSKRILEKILNIVPSHIEQIRLSVGAYNIPARKLYQAYGFQECGIEEKVLKIGEEYINEIPMVKFIT